MHDLAASHNLKTPTQQNLRCYHRAENEINKPNIHLHCLYTFGSLLATRIKIFLTYVMTFLSVFKQGDKSWICKNTVVCQVFAVATHIHTSILTFCLPNHIFFLERKEGLRCNSISIYIGYSVNIPVLCYFIHPRIFNAKKMYRWLNDKLFLLFAMGMDRCREKGNRRWRCQLFKWLSLHSITTYLTESCPDIFIYPQVAEIFPTAFLTACLIAIIVK